MLVISISPMSSKCWKKKKVYVKTEVNGVVEGHTKMEKKEKVESTVQNTLQGV